MALYVLTPPARAMQTRDLIPGVADDSHLAQIGGRVSPILSRATDLGPVEDSFTASRMLLLLNRSSEQERALEQFIAGSNSPGNPHYHAWLTPQEFGEKFGPSDADIATITAWLQSQGFIVDRVHPGKMFLEFSGTAGQVREAFHTTLHRYRLGTGQMVIANASAPEVPSSLTNAIHGISIAPTVHLRPLAHVASQAPSQVSYDLQTHIAQPEWTYPMAGGGNTYELAPADFAVQYDVASVYKSGVNGAGQSIGILSDSNIDLSLVAAYQSLFGLIPNLPSVMIDGNDPGQTTDAPETYFDVEEASAVAPGAQVILYTSAGSVLTDPLMDAALRALEDNQVSVLSVSYGACESELGASGNAMWSALWQQAAAQGITVFAATGDSGSAACDNPATQDLAYSGLAVNGVASTLYDVAVGGTDFYYSSYASPPSTLQAQIGSYWGMASATAPAVSLLQTAPEQAWNDAFGLNASDGGVYSSARSSILAGGGGSSSAAIYPTSGSVTGYPKPVWQTGSGVPADSRRDVPDLSLFSGDGANLVKYPFCANPGDCTNTTSTGAVVLTSAGGTSVAASAMAGIQALVNQATNSRQGLANVTYYALANQSATANTFRDIATGGNAVPCLQGSANCVLATSGPAKSNYAESGYVAGTGYDLATGLGSVDVARLIANWARVTLKPTTTALTLSSLSFAHGIPVTVNAVVSPSSGSGAPTGSVAINSTDATAYSNGLALLTLTAAQASASLSDLPGGTYQVFGQYSGDSTWAPNTSEPVNITVTPERATLITTGWVLNPADGNIYPLTQGMSIPYGSQVYLDAQPAGVNEANSGARATSATGSILFSDVNGATTQSFIVPLNGEGSAEWIPAVLPVGAHSISASYSGDASYNAIAATQTAAFTVFPGTTTLAIKPMETTIPAGSSVVVEILLKNGDLGLDGALPTGTITVKLGNQSLSIKSPFNASGAANSATQGASVTFTNVPAGILPLSASYSGDTNWNASAGFYGSVQSLSSKTAPAVTLTANASSYLSSQTVSMTAVVMGTAAFGAPQGSVTFTEAGGTVSYTGALQQKTTTAATWELSLPAWKLMNGSNTFLANFAGDSNYSPQSSGPLVVILNAGDFSLTSSQQEVTISQAYTGTVPLLISPEDGFSGTVTLTCSASSSITCSAANKIISLSTSTTDVISYSIPAGLTSGTYSTFITASGGERTHTLEVLLSYAPSTATPTFFPPAGTYVTAQAVTLSDATTGATMYYTTDGSTPTVSSKPYAEPITVTSSETLNAVAIANGYSFSPAGSATYVISSATAQPVISLPGGTYSPSQTVTITDATPGASIYYTTNGSTPTASSTPYTSPLTVGRNTILQAVAIAPGYSISGVTVASYTMTNGSTPLQFIPITPCRIADTRNPAGSFGGPELAGRSTREFDIPQSSCNIPRTAIGYALNVTVAPDGPIGYLAIWPSGQPQPFVSLLNSDGRVKANAAITLAGNSGGVSIYTSDPTNVILDINGYFVPAGTTSALQFYPLTPCRIADTRIGLGPFGGPYLAGDSSRAFPILSSTCNVPANAQAYSLNITAVPHITLGYLSTWPTGSPQPYVSTLNSSSGEVEANAAIVPAGSNGEISIYTSDDTDVVLDINGYFAPPSSNGLSLYSVTPCRIIDTRADAQPFPGTLLVPVATSPCALPTTAAAYVLNATVVPSGSFGYLSLWAGGQPQPYVSTLNATDSAITSNMAIVPTVNGTVNAYSPSPGNLILDVSGYFAH
ncbi:chitobiase/beta-hexosaminidase C-terminal domain-containing protein [Acidicapsa dinghuensis]|nr:chitobiase/beta-hexosaminidase C-terminal domain-containing protein [Acidicapsa dinghuensis]